MTGRFFALLLLLLLCSCASTMGGGPFLLDVDSAPQGAVVVYDRAELGQTPCTIWVHGNKQDLTLRLAGHHDQEVVLGGMSNQKWVIFGFCFLGPIELLADAITNSYQHVNYAPIKVDLTPTDKPAPRTWVRSGYR